MSLETRFFWYGEAAIRNGFAQRVIANLQSPGHGRDTQAVIEMALGFFEDQGREDGGFAPTFGRMEKGTGTACAESFDPAFQGLGIEIEGANDLGLSDAAIDVKLTGDGSESRQIIFVMGIDRHRTTKIDDFAIAFFVTDIIGNKINTVEKDGKLELRHGQKLEPCLKNASQAPHPLNGKTEGNVQKSKKPGSIQFPLTFNHPKSRNPHWD
jgi:hypothetical protein